MKPSRQLLLVVVVSLAGCAAEDPEDNGDDSADGGKADGADGFACANPTWKREVIAEDVDAKYTTLRIDKQGNTHVLYRDPAADRMRYIVKNANATAWKPIPLPDTCTNVVGEPGVNTGLPLTANQNLAVNTDGAVFVRRPPRRGAPTCSSPPSHGCGSAVARSRSRQMVR